MPLISKAFSDLITFSRTGSTATYFAANGVLTAAAADVPRFDYDPATFLPRGLLIEEARTNLLTYSALIGGTNWTNQNSIVVTTNTTDVTDPSNTNTASKLVSGSATSQTLQSATLTATVHSASVYLRSLSGTTSVELYVYLTLSPFTVIGSATVTATSTWQRFSFTTSTATAASYTLAIRVPSGTVYAFGAQLEAGAFPTSYIPTTTTSLTRNADTANINTMSPWYNQVNGSVYAEFVSITDGSATQTNSNQGVWSTTQSALGSFNGYGNEVNLITNSAAKLVGRARYAPTLKNNLVQIGSTTGFIASNTIYKTAVAWDASNIVADSNIGALNSTANTAAVDMGTHNRMTLGSQNVGGSPPYQLNGWLRKITFYPTKLSDANLGILTT